MIRVLYVDDNVHEVAHLRTRVHKDIEIHWLPRVNKSYIANPLVKSYYDYFVIDFLNTDFDNEFLSNTLERSRVVVTSTVVQQAEGWTVIVKDLLVDFLNSFSVLGHTPPPSIPS